MLTINDFLKERTKERSVTFWGEETTYKPYLCDAIIGDGMQLVYLQPIDSRPYLWLIRIDSKTDVSADDYDYEEILMTIEDECGRCDLDKCESCTKEKYCEYPSIHWGGGMWGKVADLSIYEP